MLNLLQNPYNITHLTLGMLLHYLGKFKIQIVRGVVNYESFSLMEVLVCVNIKKYLRWNEAELTLTKVVECEVVLNWMCHF